MNNKVNSKNNKSIVRCHYAMISTADAGNQKTFVIVRGLLTARLIVVLKWQHKQYINGTNIPGTDNINVIKCKLGIIKIIIELFHQ